jgi:hypothetical protein
MKLPGLEPDFFLSKITRPRWLELPIARTDFDSHFEFEPAKLVRFSWPIGFRGEESKKSANQKQESPVAVMFVNGSG